MNYNNLAQRTNFIAGSEQFKNLPFFLINVNIPGITLSHPEVGGKHGARMNLSGDTAVFNSLAFEMLVDEDFIIYQEFMNIIRKNIDLKTGTYSDFYFDFFIELSNNKGNKVLKLDFTNCRIESIGDIILDSQDDSTQYTMTIDMRYDYFEMEQRRVFNVKGNPSITSQDDYQQKTFNEEFSEISDDWLLWGFPVPILSTDTDGSIGLDTNGGGNLESGAVLNGVPIEVARKFSFSFRVKQPLSSDGDTGNYIEFGITRGAGIENTTNGRTGATVCGVIVDGGSKDLLSIKNISYIFDNENDIKENYTNDGEYHTYRIDYTINGTMTTFNVYMDDVLQATSSSEMTMHDNYYVYVQGKSENALQFLDTISGTYGKL